MTDQDGVKLPKSLDPRPAPAKVLVLCLFAVAFFGSIVLLRSPGSQSGWRWERKGDWNAFVEKLVPENEVSLFLEAFPAAAAAAFRAVGVEPPSIPAGELTAFAAWGSYRSVRIDDPLISRSLVGRSSGELRQVALMAAEFELDEPVASCYVSPDGRYFFLDLRGVAAEGLGGLEASVAHGVAHALARARAPESARALAFGAEGAAFRFLDEAAALYLADAAMARARGIGYAELSAARWAPEGSALGGREAEALFSSDSRPPEYFAAAAALARAIAVDKGEAAMGELAARLSSGSYLDLDDLASPIASGVGQLFLRYAGSATAPE